VAWRGTAGRCPESDNQTCPPVAWPRSTPVPREEKSDTQACPPTLGHAARRRPEKRRAILKPARPSLGHAAKNRISKCDAMGWNATRRDATRRNNTTRHSVSLGLFPLPNLIQTQHKHNAENSTVQFGTMCHDMYGNAMRCDATPFHAMRCPFSALHRIASHRAASSFRHMKLLCVLSKTLSNDSQNPWDGMAWVSHFGCRCHA
jgi:hypothetical protein